MEAFDFLGKVRQRYSLNDFYGAIVFLIVAIEIQMGGLGSYIIVNPFCNFLQNYLSTLKKKISHYALWSSQEFPLKLRMYFFFI